MARRIFFHIGVPKSGTTYLQTAMWHNRPALRAQGFLYPGSKRMDHYHASEIVRGAPPSRLGPNSGAWDDLVGSLRSWKGDGLISHEFFCMATAEQAQAAVSALAPAEVHVVLTARDYVRQFPAVWQEALKMRRNNSLDEFMELAFAGELHGGWSWDSQDVPAVLERWAGAVPTERVHVVTLPPAGADRGLLWQRWRDVLGIDDSAFDMDLTFGNESLGAAQAALLHRVKPHLTAPLTKSPVAHRWVRAYFGHEVLVPQRGDRFGLRAQDAARLRQRSIETVAAVERAGYQVSGDLADLVPAEHQPPQAHPDEVTETEMLEVAARAIDQMIHDVRRLTAERDRWRREAQRPFASVNRLRRLAARLRRGGAR